MKIEVVEGTRIAAGETLVVVPPSPMPQVVMEHLRKYATDNGFRIMVLPHNCKVYIKERDDAARG